MNDLNIAILGAGISGLTIAHYLQKIVTGLKVTLYEKSSYPGGWIKTDRKNRFLFEKGPRGCRPKGSGLATLELIEELSLRSQVIKSSSHSKTRFLFTKEGLLPLPQHPFQLLTSKWRSYLPALLKEPFKKRGGKDDETIASFFSRRFNSQMVTDLIDPFVLGIYAGDVHMLSIKSCFPNLFSWEKEYGSLLRGLFVQKKENRKKILSPFQKEMQNTPLFSFLNGMQTLTEALTEKLEHRTTIKTNTEVFRLHSQTNGVKIETSKESERYDWVFSTLSFSALADLLSPYHSDTLSFLPFLPYCSINSVSLAYENLKLPQNGFGYLIPSKYQSMALGVVWDSQIFPQQQKLPCTVLTVMLREELNQEESLSYAKKLLREHLKIETPPIFETTHHASSALPQYPVGFSEKLQLLNNHITQNNLPLTLGGQSVSGVSVNDCIFHSKSLAQNWCSKILPNLLQKFNQGLTLFSNKI